MLSYNINILEVTGQRGVNVGRIPFPSVFRSNHKNPMLSICARMLKCISVTQNDEMHPFEETLILEPSASFLPSVGEDGVHGSRYICGLDSVNNRYL